MLKVIDIFAEDSMDNLKEIINDIPTQYPFNLAKDLSDQHRYCDIQKLYDVINNKLSPKYKAALVLRYKYKYTYKRIGQSLGYSSGYSSILIHKILHRLRNYYDIYVYDKEYISSCIKNYEHEIDNLRADIDKLKKYRDCLMDLVLRDHPNMYRSSLIGKMDNALKFMDTNIDVLDLSPRVYTILNRKYNNLYELSCATIEDLWKIRGFGIDEIKEVVDKLYYNDIYIEHETVKNIVTGQVKYISKNDMDEINHKYWKLI